MVMEYTQIGLTPNRSNLDDEQVRLPLRLLWKAQALAPFAGQPLVSTNRVVVDSISSARAKVEEKLYVFDANAGEKVWEYKFEGGSGVGDYCLFDGMIITHTKESMVALSLNEGKQIWGIEGLGGYIGYSIIYKGVLILSRGNGVHFIDPLRGSMLKTLDVRRARPVSCFKDKVVFGDWDGRTYCFDFESGTKIWEKSIAKIGECAWSKDEIRPGEMSSGILLVTEGNIFFSLTMHTCCFDLDTGDLKWKTELPLVRYTAYKNGKLCLFDGNYMFCLNSVTGEIIYKKGGCKRSGADASIPFISGDTFWVSSIGVYAFDIISGNLIWEFYSKRYYPFVTQRVFINGRLYVGCSDGFLYCFETKNNRKLKP